ncbi:hypothetical protein JTE90_003306 [Oedothorax gibbosus]|uniref:PPM-type phosphatase domain-containing protein n=1 Tax=Oedothorax gibbosus TaxID=931172 RepID=A0AAV6TX08_9ARAC|nr:hypothetical protein JTE90_003306 [Oedothorax gibbosus]
MCSRTSIHLKPPHEPHTMTIVFSGTTTNNSRTSGNINHGPITDIPIRQDEIKLSNRDLTSFPEDVRKTGHFLRILDVSGNRLRPDDLSTGLSGLKGLERVNLSVNELKDLSVDLGLLPFLEVVCLSGNELEVLPKGIVSLSRLRRLHCDFNRLSSLPLDWSPLSSLTSLTLSCNRLQEVPATLWTLHCLQVLDLRRNRIACLGPMPEGAACRLRELRLGWNRLAGRLDLSKLTSVCHLDVSHNSLEELEISELQKLESLSAGHNALRSLELDGSRLKSLDVERNEIECITCKIVPLHLQSIDVSHNNFQSLPVWITESRSLHSLTANHNKLSHVPKELFGCCNLMNLKLSHNQLVEFPEITTQCSLKYISLQYNKFEKLPENFFTSFTSLESLNLSYNRLTSLPTSPCNSSVKLKSLLLSGNQLRDQLKNLVRLLSVSKLESLHLSYNEIKELPDGFFESLSFLRTLSLCGNELESVSSQISKALSLEKLYLHSNQLVTIPKFSETNNLKVLDLACNRIHQLELASIVPKDLTYLDLSANCSLQIDPTDFHHLCCQRSVAVVDVNCAGREAPLGENAKKETDIACPWILGFTESQDGNTRIYIEFQRDPSSGRQEALIALVEVDDSVEVAHLRAALPHLLREERARSPPQDFLGNALMSSIRFVRGRGYLCDVGITMCQLSSCAGNPLVTLRLGTVGRPASCVLGRAGNVIVLAQRQDSPPFDLDEWSAAMQATEVCCNNSLSSRQSPLPAPGGSWCPIPEPEVRELVLSPQDRFLVFGDSSFSTCVPPEEIHGQVIGKTSPVAASKALSEMSSALAGGRRECVAVISLRAGDPSEPEEEVEKYRCWEFMLEQNHKLLFTKELETIHKTILHTGSETKQLSNVSVLNVESSDVWYTTAPATVVANGDPWYSSALSKYKCPLPSHRGRYYCYGNKTETDAEWLPT